MAVPFISYCKLALAVMIAWTLVVVLFTGRVW